MNEFESLLVLDQRRVHLRQGTLLAFGLLVPATVFGIFWGNSGVWLVPFEA